MRFFRYFALLSILLVPAAAYSHAQVAVGVGIGGPVYGGYGYYPPDCAYGYYGYYPYACAPYGYYGPAWFNGGLFIGAGPWFRRGFGFRGGFYGRPVYGRPGFGYGRPGFGYGRPGYGGGFRGTSTVRGGFAGGGFHGNAVGGGFHGGGGGGFHGGGGGGFHGGGGHR
jgi:hypothetical protein